MEIIKSIKDWPQKIVKNNESGVWEKVNIDIKELIYPAYRKFLYENVRPNHLLVGFDCRDELIYNCYFYLYGMPFSIEGMDIVWSKDEGIRMFYSPKGD